MKELYEFNLIVTPENWIEEVLEFQKEGNDNIVDFNSSKKGVPFMNENIKTKKKSKFTIKVVLIASAILILSCISVFAYGVMNGYYDLSGTPLFKGIFSDADKERIQEAGIVQQDGGLKVTCTDVIAQDSKVVFRVMVETEDGSSLYDNTESRWTVSQRFYKANLLVDGEICNVSASGNNKIDDGSVASRAIYEFSFVPYEPQKLLESGQIQLQLQNYMDRSSEIQDIGMSVTNLQELLGDVKLADSDEFYQLESGHQPNIGYGLKPGDQHIQFSNDYPDSYIDNVGIYDRQLGGRQVKSLYIGITMGSFDDYSVLKNIRVMNKDTADFVSMNLNDAYRLDSDRLILNLIPAVDPAMVAKYNTDSVDFIPEMLNQYKLAVVNSRKDQQVVKYKGNWSFDIQLDENKFGQVKSVSDKVIETPMGEINIVSLAVRDMDVTIEGTCVTNFMKDKRYEDDREIELVMKDGSICKFKPNVTSYSIGSSDVTGNFQLRFDFKSVIDSSSVKSIKWLQNEFILE